MKNELTFKQMRGMRFLSDIFIIISKYIRYAQMKDTSYALSKDGISNRILIDGVSVFQIKYFFEKLGVSVMDDIKSEALVDLELILAKLGHSKDKNDFTVIKKMCLDFHKKWYPY